MKTMLSIALIATCSVLLAAPSFADTAQLELFSDAALSSCSLTDVPGLVIVYVAQTGGEPMSGVQFSAPKPACWNATWVGDEWGTSGGEFGNSQTLASVAYGECRTAPALVIKMLFLSAGSTSPCCAYNTLDADIYSDCVLFHDHPLETGPRSVTINPDASCPCALPVAVEPSTWGRVKSLYR